MGIVKINSNMFRKYLIIIIAITKALAGQNGDNFCSQIVEQTKVVNGETLKFNETVSKCCEGYITVKDECKPQCGNCNNGVCIKPNVCKCNMGHLWNETSRTCAPICDCINGYCPKPYQCVCNKGYAKPTKTSNKCEPVCQPECPTFSMCTRPQTCECFKGYQKDPHTDECEIKCDDKLLRPDFEVNQCVLKNCTCSSGGYCLHDYNECHCYEGFRRTYDNRCEPVCQETCENAECKGANQCECLRGYHATADPNVCEPNDLCRKQLCENGECLQTGECKCKKGFTKSFTFKGQRLCETMSVFIGKIMSIILGIPLTLASIVLLVVYVVARRKNKQNTVQTCGEDDGDNVVYACN